MRTRVSDGQMSWPWRWRSTDMAVRMSRALPADRPTESDLAGPIRSDAELRALLGQVRDGAMWQVGRIETFGRVPLADALAEVQAELARAMR